MQTVTAEWLQRIEALKDVPAGQLQWLIDNSRHYEMPAGEMLFEQGEPIAGTHILISGRVKAYQVQQKEAREITVWGPKAIFGYLPFSRGKIAIAFGEIRDDAQVMTLPISKIEELIRNHFELTQALVHIMTNRVRDFTSFQLQNEKMAALGKLSAGLAHELNNPAAAVVRGAVSLKQHLQMMPGTFKKVMAIRMSPEEVDIINERLFNILNQPKGPALSMMQRSDREEELMDWLDDHNIENAAELAENLVDFGFTIELLNDFKKDIPEADLSPVFNWINSNLVTEKMVTDIEEASKRIATLVGSIKTFTHMDQGRDRQLTDIHRGIENTLNILQYRLRKGNVELQQHFDQSLPQIKVCIGEMNQVWTNLIDNALDAMEPARKGVLQIRTERDHDCVLVSVIDNGPGIPPEMISRVFDPFFTTKEVGKGTGLGLDIVCQIVKQHRGNVKVTSEPGNTRFMVSLPMQDN
ncbi:ATP-binding protein [uncultured Chitinophaga sp.]|jgi:Signal transduction histidine kinase regulating C4-dicarboxylate transport system|uniref:sensor histidine kinase n=1 Tax=uncultured Chitinophaga sp. TaxID=339340 RepID=UPI002608CACC|nr:ATP-binding protein [uncultured Chitinophaga sp.]